MVKAEIIDTTFALMEDYHENVQIRNLQYQESKNFDKTEEEEEEDEYESPTTTDPTTRGVSLKNIKINRA